MRHKKRFRTLSRNKSARKSMFRNMCVSLVKSGYVVTSEAKGKELRKYFEPLVTKAKQKMTLAVRRDLISELGSNARAEELITRATKQTKRQSGFLRLAKLPVTSSDGAKKVRVEIIE
ncbi:MAG: 50S ribosomal protein L17 [Parcubacteria group bacterium GW2011_GWA2_45_14]|nr:MAG: 50S ribosomal protein L17 [Parcubacteria group bacterium GW2011_GWA2_45_14]